MKVSEEDFKKNSAIEKDLRILDKKDDIRFGEVTIIERGRDTKKIIMKYKTFGSKQELGAEIALAKTRLTFSHENLLTFLDFSTGCESGFCSSIYWMKLFFECPNLDLEKELRRRVKSNIIGLNSHELTHLLYNTVQAGAFLHSKGFAHGNINPKNIEVDRPDLYKLVESFGNLAKPEEQAYAKLKAGGLNFMSPELYSRHVYSNPNVAKAPVTTQMLKTSDCFSLGFTILFASCDKSLNEFYKPNGNVDIELLEKYKESFAQKFPTNKLLTSTVFALLEVDPARRPKDLQEVLKQLLPYEHVQQSIEQEIQQEMNSNQQSQQDVYANYASNSEWETEWVSGQPSRSLANSHAEYPQLSSSQFNGHQSSFAERRQPTSPSPLRESYYSMQKNHSNGNGFDFEHTKNQIHTNQTNSGFHDQTNNQYYNNQMISDPKPQRPDPPQFMPPNNLSYDDQPPRVNFTPQPQRVVLRQTAPQQDFSAFPAQQSGQVYTQVSNPLTHGFGFRKKENPVQQTPAYPAQRQEHPSNDYQLPEASQRHDLQQHHGYYYAPDQTGVDQHPQYADYSSVQSNPNAYGNRGY